MYHIIKYLLLATISVILGLLDDYSYQNTANYEPIIETIAETTVVKAEVRQTGQRVVKVKKLEPNYGATDEEIELLALLTMAEAEGEPEYGQRLVIDTVLNRVDHDDTYWPDTIAGVIYQTNQFESMWNGRVDRSTVTDEMRNLVKQELLQRTNSEVLYFRADRYGAYGDPMFSVGDHYFSSY